MSKRNKNQLKELALGFLIGIGILTVGLIIVIIGIGIYSVQKEDLTEFAQLLLFIFCAAIVIGGIRVMFYAFKEIKPFTKEFEEWWGVKKDDGLKTSPTKRIFYAILGTVFILTGILGATLWIIWCFHFNSTAEFVSMGHILGFIIVFVLILVPLLFVGYLSLRAFLRNK